MKHKHIEPYIKSRHYLPSSSSLLQGELFFVIVVALSQDLCSHLPATTDVPSSPLVIGTVGRLGFMIVDCRKVIRKTEHLVQL